MKTFKSNLNHFILAHILLGHEIEAYMIFDAGGPNTVAVCHREKSEIALWRARGVKLGQIRNGGDGPKKGWRYVYGWRVKGSGEPFYIGAATDWKVRTKQELATAQKDGVTVQEKKNTLGQDWLTTLCRWDEYLPIFFKYADKGLRTVLAKMPQELRAPYTHKQGSIIALPCGLYTTSWFSAKELMKAFAALDRSHTAAIAAGKIRHTGGSSFSLTQQA